MLSLVAGRDHGFHTRARILTLALGVLALVTWWRVGRKHVGPRAALILAAFLAVSECFIDYSGRESCEPLLLFFWALSVGAILDGLQDPRQWLAAGAYAGLAQLDKGSGIFLVFCFGLALLLWRGWRALRDPWAWGMGLAFLAAASPLLVRNRSTIGTTGCCGSTAFPTTPKSMLRGRWSACHKVSATGPGRRAGTRSGSDAERWVRRKPRCTWATR